MSMKASLNSTGESRVKNGNLFRRSMRLAADAGLGTCVSQANQEKRGRSTMINRQLMLTVLFALLAMGLVFPVAMYAQDEQLVITAIEIRGNDTVSDQDILTVMKGRAGSVFSLNTLSADIAAIEALGWFATEPEHILEPFES